MVGADIKDQIVSQMTSPVAEPTPAAVAAFMDGVPHEQFDEEVEEVPTKKSKQK